MSDRLSEKLGISSERCSEIIERTSYLTKNTDKISDIFLIIEKEYSGKEQQLALYHVGMIQGRCEIIQNFIK